MKDIWGSLSIPEVGKSKHGDCCDISDPLTWCFYTWFLLVCAMCPKGLGCCDVAITTVCYLELVKVFCWGVGGVCRRTVFFACTRNKIVVSRSKSSDKDESLQKWWQTWLCYIGTHTTDTIISLGLMHRILQCRMIKRAKTWLWKMMGRVRNVKWGEYIWRIARRNLF